jgi:hypothetical protein
MRRPLILALTPTIPHSLLRSPCLPHGLMVLHQVVLLIDWLKNDEALRQKIDRESIQRDNRPLLVPCRKRQYSEKTMLYDRATASIKCHQWPDIQHHLPMFHESSCHHSLLHDLFVVRMTAMMMTMLHTVTQICRPIKNSANVNWRLRCEWRVVEVPLGGGCGNLHTLHHTDKADEKKKEEGDNDGNSLGDTSPHCGYLTSD